MGRFLQTDPLPPRWQEMNRYVVHRLRVMEHSSDQYGTTGSLLIGVLFLSLCATLPVACGLRSPADGRLTSNAPHRGELTAGSSLSASRRRLQIAQQFMDQGQPGNAIAELETVLDTDPTHQGALLLLGRACRYTGNLQRSEEALLRALGTETDRAPALNELALLYAYTDLLRPGERFPKSFGLLRMAVGLDPSNFGAHINLASLLEEQCPIDAQYCAEAMRAWVKVEEVSADEHLKEYARERRKALASRPGTPAEQ